jgi:hypothetical protein
MLNNVRSNPRRSQFLLALLGLLGLSGPLMAQEREPITWATLAESDREGAIEFLPNLAGGYVGGPDGPVPIYSTTALEYQRSALMLGLAPEEVARRVEQLPGNVSMVFGRYDPANTTLRIDVFKVERAGQRTGLYQTQFTPAHGDHWALSGAYLTDMEKLAGDRVGPNPFERFDNGTSNFVNITIDGVQVALGHAMRLFEAPVGVLAVADYRAEQSQAQVGELLRKLVVVSSDGYIKPRWYIAAPAVMQGQGTSAAICATVADPCPVSKIAPALVMFQEWRGGTMPGGETLALSWSETAAGWDFTAFNAASFVSSLVVSSFAASAFKSDPGFVGPSETLTKLLSEGGFGEAVVPTGSIPSSAFSGGIYSGATAIAEGGSKHSVQVNFEGKAGYGTLTDDMLSERAARTEFETNFAATGAVLMAGGNIDSTHPALESYFYGTCEAGTPLSDCDVGAPTGIIPRSDIYVEHAGLQFFRDNGSPALPPE